MSLVKARSIIARLSTYRSQGTVSTIGEYAVGMHPYVDVLWEFGGTSAERGLGGGCPAGALNANAMRVRSQ